MVQRSCEVSIIYLCDPMDVATVANGNVGSLRYIEHFTSPPVLLLTMAENSSFPRLEVVHVPAQEECDARHRHHIPLDNGDDDRSFESHNATDLDYGSDVLPEPSLRAARGKSRRRQSIDCVQKVEPLPICDLYHFETELELEVHLFFFLQVTSRV